MTDENLTTEANADEVIGGEKNQEGEEKNTGEACPKCGGEYELSAANESVGARMVRRCKECGYSPDEEEEPSDL